MVMWLLGHVLLWLGFILLGASVIVGAVLMLAKWIGTDLIQHPADCDCMQCQAYRQGEWEKAQEAERLRNQNQPHQSGHTVGNIKPPEGLSHWQSTVELVEGAIVLSANRHSAYRVLQIHHRDYGYVVILQNDSTKKQSHVTVPNDKLHKKMWLMRMPRKGSREDR
jgi:hypothetical protein